MKTASVRLTLRNLRKLIVKPGEVLVLMTEMRLTGEAVRNIERQFATVMPGQMVVILEEGMKLGVVRPAVEKEEKG
jgi:ribosomal protein RSM22 (predicted rRNA methylase)